MPLSLDEEWLNFQNTDLKEAIFDEEESKEKEKKNIPKCSNIYISTQTKIGYLNSKIKLYELFWKLPVQKYFEAKEGIIKKSIKINCNTKDEVKKLEEKISAVENINVTVLSQVDNPNGRKVKFKDIRKIDVGLCKKDLTSYRKKKRGAFYNCFALILRIKYKNEFKEVHVKIFNTGKLEIPGIQYDDLLILTLDKLVDILKPYIPTISYDEKDVDTVLINSNFNCGFYIDRFKLFKKLRHSYNFHASYDPCSYPGIQCKFYYNKMKKDQDGIYDESIEEKWLKVSFMIFRTGSVLIVGNCNSDILQIIYNRLKEILKKEFYEISIENNGLEKKKIKKKVRKKVVLFKIK